MIVFVAGSGLQEVCSDQAALGLTYLRNARTAPIYRLFAIEDRFATLVDIGPGGISVAGELCDLAEDRIAAVLAGEPPGVQQKSITLDDGSVVSGPTSLAGALGPNARDISAFGGFAAYARTLRVTGKRDQEQPQPTSMPEGGL